MFPAISLGFTFFFFFCIPSYISGVHHSSSSSSEFPATSLGFTFFFFYVPSYISGVHLLLLSSQLHLWGSPSSSSSVFPATSLRFTIPLLLLPRSQLHLWGSPSSSSAFPATSLGFTILLLLPSKLYLWGSPFFFFCVPSYILGFHYSSSVFPARVHHSSSSSVFPARVHHSSSSSVFPATSLGFTIPLLLLLCSQLHLCGPPFFFFFRVLSYISGVHHSSFSSSFPATSLGFSILGESFAYVTVFLNPTIQVVTFRLHRWCMLGVFLLPAFTRLGHERQDLLSPCDGMHVCTDKTSVYTLIRKISGWNGVRTHVNSKGKIPSTGKNSPQRRVEPTMLHQAGQ